MSEFNEYNSENQSYRRTTKVKKSGHPILTVLLSMAMGLAAGAGGSYYVLSHYGTSGETDSTTVEYQTSTSTTHASQNTTSGSLTITEAAAKAAPSTVEIVTEASSTSYGFFGGTYTTQSAGSGVIISTDGYIITNNHVIEGATSITVTLYDGTEYEAELVGTDSKSDIAVLKINADNLTAATIGDSSTVAAGDTAIVIGNPLGTLGGTVTNGIISAASREITVDGETMELIQTDAAINSGNSGGGLFDGDGNLIGIVNMKDSGTTSSGAVIEGLGFAIPINTAMEVAEQLIEYGKVVNRPTIGVYLQTLSQASGQYPAGLYITGVVEGSPAEDAGLQAYDRIIAIDDTEVDSYETLSRYLNTKEVGDVITLTIVRDNETQKVEITLGSSN